MFKTLPRILVSDFDGTMTRFDFFDLARRDLPSAADHDHWADYVDGRITHFEALERIFASIRTDWDGIEGVLQRMELDPGLPGAVERLRAAGWEIIVASAGCAWYIHRLLDRAKVQLPVYANPGVFAPETGLVLSLPVDSPYYRHETGIDKSAIVRAALKQDPNAVFAGDGRPDFAPSTLVRAGRRFARGWLAQHCEKLGEPCHPFETWSDIADRLLETP
ncbi:MAG: HAD-IB family phosphatase [Lentisphaerae bacterium]|nr:HAD-IB family phosphatase [Lentisphaerota bacterium]